LYAREENKIDQSNFLISLVSGKMKTKERTNAFYWVIFRF
jgi:hypothetical protein